MSFALEQYPENKSPFQRSSQTGMSLQGMRYNLHHSNDQKYLKEFRAKKEKYFSRLNEVPANLQQADADADADADGVVE